MLARFRAAGLAGPLIATMVGIAILLALGTWQMQRKHWKEGLVAAIATRASQAPVTTEQWDAMICDPSLPFSAQASCEYRPAILRGHFLHDEERHVFTSGLPAVGGNPGYLVMTPFVLANREDGTGVFVNRGFVPEIAKDASQRSSGQVQGDVEISGVIRRAEPIATFTPKGDAAKNIWFARNPAEFMGEALLKGFAGVPRNPPKGPDPVEFYIDQTGAAAPGGIPAPVGGRIELTNRHLEYALTWYGLAVTLAGVFIAFVLARLRADNPSL